MAGQLFNPALTLMERGYLSANNAELLPSCCFPPAIPFKRLANPFRPPASRQLLWPFFAPLAIFLLPVPSTFLPSAAAHALQSRAWAPGPLHKESRIVLLTSFSDKDCQESRLQTKGLFLQEAKWGEGEMPEAAGAGRERWQPAQLFGSSDHIFSPVFWGRMEQCLQLSSSALDWNLSFHPLPMSPGGERSLIAELWGLGVLFVLVVSSHRKPLKSLLRRRAFGMTDTGTCQSKPNQAPAHGGLPGAGGGQEDGCWVLPPPGIWVMELPARCWPWFPNPNGGFRRLPVRPPHSKRGWSRAVPVKCVVSRTR